MFNVTGYLEVSLLNIKLVDQQITLYPLARHNPCY